jgi:type IV fimbrial biogenesis protein FimT
MLLYFAPRPRPHQGGFTLIELTVTLALAALLTVLAAPSFSRLIADNRSTTQTEEFMGALQLARSEAIRRGVAITLRASSDSSDFTAGWTTFTDANADGAPPSTVTDKDGTVLREAAAMSMGSTLTRVKRVTATLGTVSYTTMAISESDRMFVVFNELGGNDAGTSAYFKLCSSNAAVGGRIVQVSAVGRISLDNTQATCP